jgi:putative heme iron utilization protein
VVKRDELLGALPEETAMVSESERATAMWERFHGIRRRYVL